MSAKSSLEEMLEEYLNPRPKAVEAAEDLIGGGAAVMPFHSDLEVESASKGKKLHKAVKEHLPLRASDLSMGTRYLGTKVSRKDLEEDGWEASSGDDDDDDEQSLKKAPFAEEDDDEDEDDDGEGANHGVVMEEDEDDGEDDEEEGADDGAEHADGAEDAGQDEESEGEEDESEEELTIDRSGKIAFKPKAKTASPATTRKRHRAEQEDEDDDEEDDEEDDGLLDEDVDDAVEDEEDKGKGDDDEEDEDEEDMETLGLMAEQEGEDKLEKELRKLKEEEKHAVTSIKSDNRKELEKAVHTKNQKLLWNNFMELRIAFQQALTTANRFPSAKAYPLFVSPPKGASTKQRPSKKLKTSEDAEKSDDDDEEEEEEEDKLTKKSRQLKEGLDEAASSLASLFNGLVTAKKTLLAANDSFASVLEGQQASANGHDEDDDGMALEEREDGDAAPVEPRWDEFVAVENNLWEKADEVIDRWNRKTMLSQGIMQKEFKAINRTVLNQISQLMADQQRLVRRTQLRRSAAKVFGAALFPQPAKQEDVMTPAAAEENPGGKKKQKEEEYDEEIFDDFDFYHQLLRELVESGTADVTDPIALGRTHAQLRRLLRKNKKKDVDQKASKGRKIRYDVMAPLVNFMPPITQLQQGAPMANELFQNLFSS